MHKVSQLFVANYRAFAITLVLIFWVMTTVVPVFASTENVLYNFAGGLDGAQPVAGLIWDGAGNLYGTTLQGGPSNEGTVFKLDSTGHETVLYAFAGGSDGANPHAGVVRDSSGNLYGTTWAGGSFGAGTVFKLSPSGTETVLHSFTGGSDGANPGGSLVLDSLGNLYSTTHYGGSGSGTVFKLDPAGSETVLYTFAGGADGANPATGVIEDSQGNFYGTTQHGGTDGSGTVYELDSVGVETVMYNFSGGADGAQPLGRVIRDTGGNLYGTTTAGGSGYGVVFKVAPSGAETTLYSFSGGADGAYPYAGLVEDNAGNLYGITYQGGSSGYGVVFEVGPTGQETALYSFTQNIMEAVSEANLLLDSSGNLYGTTEYGGTSGVGSVFEIQGIGPAPFLSAFPLLNQNAYTAAINSIFDHSMGVTGSTQQYQYCADGIVTAYTNEVGSSAYKPKSLVSTNTCVITDTANKLYGYEQAKGKAFSVNGQYVGAGTPQYLFYDGHPGYDYRAACNTPVYAAASGTVRYPATIPGASGSKFHILEIDPDTNTAYKLYYLHLANYKTNTCPTCTCTYQKNVAAAGAHVNAGDLVGYSGDAGVPGSPHLHFEVQTNGIPVDPYGWAPTSCPATGCPVDPYTRAINYRLWE